MVVGMGMANMHNIYPWLRSYNKRLTEKMFYCLSKKSWPILYGILLYKTGHDLVGIQYLAHCVAQLIAWPAL